MHDIESHYEKKKSNRAKRVIFKYSSPQNFEKKKKLCAPQAVLSPLYFGYSS